ncbi:MAG: arabinan endo-1,5-alpha-L-arabinosidase [Phocaeicola sp.]
MKRKHLIETKRRISSLPTSINQKNIFWSALASVVLCSCHATDTFAPFPMPNPWGDNYQEVVAMEHYKEWGVYNVHDPACRKIGDTYYTYSTDAIYGENQKEAAEKGVPLGYIQVRKSKDLVKWDFVGWAFDEIPQEARTWVHSQAGGEGATNIWAPYLMPYKDKYRLYYSVSAFGLRTSYIGMAESNSPEGPWEQKGCVVKTSRNAVMNAIDPSVVIDPETGKWWMHYGSYFGGLFCMELNPSTGLAATPDDQGHLIARRANYLKDNLEAPEILYNPELKKYYLFTSYDPLMTTYNVRVAYSDHAEGPFVDFYGNDVKDTVNQVPILTAPYQFENHPGWAGPAHCGVVTDGKGKYFMLHQGRLSPENHMMVLHVRELFFTENGWPVVSPERYTATAPRTFTREDLVGEWEIIRITEPPLERNLEAGQILWGEGDLLEKEQARSKRVLFDEKGEAGAGKWSFNRAKQLLSIKSETETITNLIVFPGHDWENEQETVLFTGLDNHGCSVWGKRIK